MNKVNQHRTKRLAALVYEKGLRAQIKEEIESKYEKRIEYLIGANNELFHKLEQCEKEKERFASIADNILLNEELT